MWLLATTNPLTSYEPNSINIPEDFEGLDTIFRGALTQLSNHDIDKKPANTEVDNEHLGSAFASPLLTHEREARADLTRTYHPNKESLLRSAPSVSVSTGHPVPWSANQKSSRELDGEGITAAPQTQRGQILATAKFEI